MKDKLNSILNQSWEFSYDRKMTFQKMRLFSYAYVNELPRIFKADFGPALHRVIDSINSEYLVSDKFHKALLQIESILSNTKSIKIIIGLKKTIVNEYKKSVPFVDKMPLSYKSYNNIKLWKSYERYCSMEKTLSFATVLLFTRFEEPLTNTLAKLLQKRLGDNKKVEDIFAAISSPTAITPLDMYNRDLLKICLNPKERHKRLLNSFSKKYISWGHYDVNYNESTFATHKQNFNELNAKTAKEDLSGIKTKYRSQKNKTDRVLNELKNDKHVYHLMDLFVCYANYKDWKNFYREQSSYKLKILLREIALRLDLKESLVAFLTVEEIRDGLKGIPLLSSFQIEKRLKNSVFLCTKGNFEIITDQDILNKIDEVLKSQISSTIAGIGAYQGLVRGYVKIIMSNQDLHKLNEGNILVTGTTRPDYIQAMMKAGGFVTNEGGLLSHAAITARELKKPCIIGTKIATKVLKDGDLVEVDANTGMVKILKKAVTALK